MTSPNPPGEFAAKRLGQSSAKQKKHRKAGLVMPSTPFKQADVRRAVKAALDAGFPLSTVELELPNGVKVRLLPGDEAPRSESNAPEPW